ncbi:MAG: hypothetical protein ACK515_12340 [bacterium]|jgi:hypothetical protein|nr:hypothetical protein [Betaproteobacteria bacterium]
MAICLNVQDVFPDSPAPGVQRRVPLDRASPVRAHGFARVETTQDV